MTRDAGGKIPDVLGTEYGVQTQYGPGYELFLVVFRSSASCHSIGPSSSDGLYHTVRKRSGMCRGRSLQPDKTKHHPEREQKQKQK